MQTTLKVNIMELLSQDQVVTKEVFDLYTDMIDPCVKWVWTCDDLTIVLHEVGAAQEPLQWVVHMFAEYEDNEFTVYRVEQSPSLHHATLVAADQMCAELHNTGEKGTMMDYRKYANPL